LAIARPAFRSETAAMGEIRSRHISHSAKIAYSNRLIYRTARRANNSADAAKDNKHEAKLPSGADHD
jgi:hypothetical protein